MSGLISLFIVMFVVFFSYILFIWLKYGSQRSISASYYVLPKKINILFTLFCWGFAFPAIIIGTTLTNSGLMFFAGAGIMFVGAAAAFKEKLTNRVHMIGAYGGVLFSQLAIAINFKEYYVNVIFLILVLLVQFLGNKINMKKIWWQEIFAFLSILYVYFVSIF